MVPGVGNADGPAAGFVWWVAKAENTAAGCSDERIAKTSCAEDRDHAIDGVALAYSTGIDLDAGTIEAHGPLACVELHMVVSHQCERLADPLGRWNMTVSAEKAPGAHERADGHIEAALARAAVLNAIGQETEQLRRDLDRMGCRLAIDTAPLALGLIVREQHVQAVGFVKSRVDGLLHGRAIGAIEDDGKRRPHGVCGSFQLLRYGVPQEQKCCERGEEQTVQDCAFGTWFFQNASYSNIASLMGTPLTSILLRSADPSPAASARSIMLSAYWKGSSPGCNCSGG